MLEEEEIIEKENMFIQELIKEPEINEYIPYNFNVVELNSICKIIETMPKFNQVEVLRILSKDLNATLNENKYGIHVNLTDLKNKTIDELKKYIKYVVKKFAKRSEMRRSRMHCLLQCILEEVIMEILQNKQNIMQY